MRRSWDIPQSFCLSNSMGGIGKQLKLRGVVKHVQRPSVTGVGLNIFPSTRGAQKNFTAIVNSAESFVFLEVELHVYYCTVGGRRASSRPSACKFFTSSGRVHFWACSEFCPYNLEFNSRKQTQCELSSIAIRVSYHGHSNFRRNLL